MKIGIITAMPEETRAVVRVLQPAGRLRIGDLVVQQGHISGHEVTVVEAGMGFANATAVAGQFLHQLHPDLVISAGFCGGIAKELQVGDAVLAEGLMIVSDNVLQQVAANIPHWCHDFGFRQNREGPRVCNGLFVSTKTIMNKSLLAALLPANAPCPVVEMESAAIALAASENGIPFIGLRTVSDPFDEELGFSLDEFCDDRMRIRIPLVLLTIARKPRFIPQLFRLARNSRIAAASLSRSIERLLSVMQ
jgi:adenosylhomocysteine nucleosidase